MQDKAKKPFISVAELATFLGISRVAVFKRIQKGQIPALKVGHSYAIPTENLDEIIGNPSKILSEEQKKTISKAVDKVVEEYGETLKLLGKE